MYNLSKNTHTKDRVITVYMYKPKYDKLIVCFLEDFEVRFLPKGDNKLYKNVTQTQHEINLLKFANKNKRFLHKPKN